MDHKKNKKTDFRSFYKDFVIEQPLTFSFLFILASISWPLELIGMPYLSKLVVDRASSGGDIYYLMLPIYMLFALKIVSNIVNRSYDYLWLHFISKLKSQMRRKLFKYVHGHSYKYFLDNESGKLAQKITSISSQSEYLITFFVELALPLSLSMLMTIYLVYRVHYVFSIIFVFWFLVDIFLSYLTGPKAMIFAKEYAEKEAELFGNITDSILNAINVKIFSSSSKEMKYLEKFEDTEVIYKKKTLKAGLKIRSLMNFVDIIFFLFFSFILIRYFKDGHITIGDIIMIFGFYNSFGRSISWMGTQIARTLESIGRVNNNLESIFESYSVQDAENASDLKVIDGEIIFKNVSFKYGDNYAIENMNLHIKGHEKIGVIGASGAGKSSLLSALLRFYDVEGSIYIDGQEIKTVTQSSLREKISYITQEPLLFSRTIFENISYGSDSTIDDVIKAARLADAHDFIISLENGYDTVVGERGLKLSGGQRQRIAIARAILKDSPIIVMDEATSALDSETETSIQKSMEHLMKNKTVIVIAHRLSTISKLDRLIIMSDGKIVEEGNHKDLVSRDTLYSKLWRLQSDGFLK
jgi:ATP-binding cassette subfamily B protein